MKKICFLVFFLFSMISISAQDHTIFLFEEFTDATIHFRNNSVRTASINYDAGKGRMLFMQDGVMMELQNAYTIDSISFGSRQFVPMGVRFAEKAIARNGIVYINWVLKDVNIGSRGAYGLPTQGHVQTLKLNDLGLNSTTMEATYDNQSVYSTDMYKRKNKNTYFFTVNGEQKEVKDIKQLAKLFPSHESEIKQYAKENKLDMKVVADAIGLIDYCLEQQ